MIKSHSAFTDNNPKLKCYLLLINTSPIMINNNSHIMVCIPKVITVGISEKIRNYHYSISAITLTAKSNSIKADAKSIWPAASTTQKNM